MERLSIILNLFFVRNYGRSAVGQSAEWSIPWCLLLFRSPGRADCGFYGCLPFCLRTLPCFPYTPFPTGDMGSSPFFLILCFLLSFRRQKQNTAHRKTTPESTSWERTAFYGSTGTAKKTGFAKPSSSLEGAGVSTESGIPDFPRYRWDLSPSLPLSTGNYFKPHVYQSHPEEFSFYRDKLLCLNAEPKRRPTVPWPNWNKKGLAAIVTQNIDGLHQKAGSHQVYALHGSIHRNYCERCHRCFDASHGCRLRQGIPHCPCGGRVKPDVVLLRRGAGPADIEGATHAIRNADLLIVGGTSSFAVYPASGLIHFYTGSKLVLINKKPHSLDCSANLVITGKIGEVLRIFLITDKNRLKIYSNGFILELPKYRQKW